MNQTIIHIDQIVEPYLKIHLGDDGLRMGMISLDDSSPFFAFGKCIFSMKCRGLL